MKELIKKIMMGMATGMAMAAMAITAYAGQWVSDSAGWWYQNDNGTYPASAWQWIDGDGDGSAECYYFDHSGYLVTNAEVDGYTLNGAGAWTVDGVVQTRVAENPSVQEAENHVSDAGEVKATLFDMEPTTSKYWKKDKNVELTNGDNWEVAMRSTTCYIQSYATYELNGEYSTLTFDAGTSNANKTNTLEIYGDDDELLYSETYEKDEAPKHAVVDISGQYHIRFIGKREEGPSMSGGILLKGLELR